MPHEPHLDVVIRSRITVTGTEFIVVCGATSRVIGGPFALMTDAVGCAVAEATNGRTRILYEAHDERGRALGERLLLRTAHTR
jgi:hypothetical protein